jgi:hypothetical protein
LTQIRTGEKCCRKKEIPKEKSIQWKTLNQSESVLHLVKTSRSWQFECRQKNIMGHDHA